jgi:hypothetical protein
VVDVPLETAPPGTDPSRSHRRRPYSMRVLEQALARASMRTPSPTRRDTATSASSAPAGGAERADPLPDPTRSLEVITTEAAPAPGSGQASPR